MSLWMCLFRYNHSNFAHHTVTCWVFITSFPFIASIRKRLKKTRTTRLIKRQDNIFMGARTCENSPALLTHNIIFIFYCDRRVLGTLVVIEWRYLFHGVHVPRWARTSHVQYKQPPIFASKIVQSHEEFRAIITKWISRTIPDSPTIVWR